MKNLVYKITNKINNKVYIGLTTQGFIQRKREHISRFNRGERDHKLYQAMKKYGIDNFEFTELFYVFDLNDLANFEIQFINEYNSFNRGYNMTVGGNTVSQETKDKLSSIFKGRKITWYDKILESRKQKGSICGGHNKQWYKIQLPSGKIVEGVSLAHFCKEHLLSQSNLVSKGKSKGYILLGRSTTIPKGSTLEV